MFNIIRFLSKALPAIVIILLIESNALAEESQFGYVYTTDMLPKGKKEFIQWVTDSFHQEGGTFNLFQGRTGLEYGLRDDLQLAAYANYDLVEADHNGQGGARQLPTTFGGYPLGGDKSYNGTSLEGLYRILSPFTDPVGLSVLFEPTIGNGLHELDSRLILQKDFLDDTVILASNVEVIGENISPLDNSAWHHKTSLIVSAASSWRFTNDWWAGVELFNWRDYNQVGFGSRIDSVFEFGPSIHYGNETFFVTLAGLEQLPLASNYQNNAEVVDGRQLAPSFTKFQVRLKFGYYF